MKKLFLLITILALAFSAKAAVVEVYPTTPNATDNIRRAVRDNASAGDIIMLMSDADAYVESSDYMLLDKDVTIMPAEGKHPIIKMNRFAELLNSATVKFIGIKFDGSDAADASKGRCLRPYDTSTGKIVKFEDCEFYGFKSHVIYCSAEFNLDSCIINNCYFHDNAMNAVYFYKSSDASVQTAKGVIITNSTFTNRGTGENGSVIEVRNQGTEPIVDDVELKVDHCTFYNNLFGEGDYSPIRSHKLGKMSVTNCIFAHPDAYAKYAVYAYGGSVSNCLTYNLTSGYKNWSPCPTLTDNITADPLFADAANGDFSLAGNWVTMNISPARNAGTDGSHLGDPRWHSAEVLPSTDFATPYIFLGEKAMLSGSFALNGSNYIQSQNQSIDGEAIWKIHAEKSGTFKITLNIATDNTSGHRYEVALYDADNNPVGTSIAEAADSWSAGDLTLGTLNIPAEGDYKIQLTNHTSHSSTVIEGVIFSYAGGAIQNIPCTMLPVDALRSSRAYIDVNDEFRFTNDDEDGHVTEEWAKWRMHATKGGYYKFATSVNSENGHSYLVTVYNADETVEKGSVSQPGTDIWGAAKNFSTDNIFLEEGDYIIKVQNTTTNSHGRIVNIVATYEGGSIIDIPATLLPIDAMHTSRAYVDVNDEFRFTNDDEDGHVTEEWAKWKMHATKGGYYKFATSVNSENGHSYLVTVYNADETVEKGSVSQPGTDIWGAPKTFSTDNIFLEEGDYIIKVQNTTTNSHGRIVNIVATYEGGAVTELPGQLLGEDAVLEATKLYRESNGDIHYDDNGTPTNEYVWWNVHAAAAGELIVTLNLDPDNGSGHNYRVELYDGSTLESYTEQGEDKWNKGNIELTDHITIPAAGNYTIRLINQTAHSSNIIKAITFTVAPVLSNVIIDEMATDNSAWVANVGGAAVNVELTRTFVGGMYNTISLPFAVTSEKVVAAFGAGVELMYMTGATLDGTVLDLEFTPTTSIYQGTPYLIKPASNVVNPQFTGVEFTVSDATTAATGGTNADFIGTFVKTTIPANVNNLYLQSGNVLMFSENDVTIKGTRAYFHVDVPSGILPVVRPRIVLNGQVLTDIELINGEPQVNGKFIENGQLIIIRDGVRYNAFGVRVK